MGKIKKYFPNRIKNLEI